MTVEVFKTNITKRRLADKLVDEIHRAFSCCQANFDLEDCDNILRVQCNKGSVQSHALIALLKNLGCHAEVLSD